jgi:hypothetical protein
MLDQTLIPVKSPSEEQSGQSVWQKNKVIITAVIFGVVVLVVLVGLLYLAVTHPADTATARDIMIIAMAVVSCMIGVLMVVLIYQVAMLTKLLRDEIKPLLESAQETVNVLRGTTEFMSDNLVEPTIKASSAVAGAQRIVQVLFGVRPGGKRRP